MVRVHDVRFTDAEPSIIMEYVPGEPLDALLEQRLLTGILSEELVILRDVATALETAAAKGIAHRDVKPANVFVLPDGHGKLGDFGLARIATNQNIFRTATDTIGGTPAYLPPEVAMGTSEPDSRSDTYSFAVMARDADRPATVREPRIMGLIAAHARNLSVPESVPVRLSPHGVGGTDVRLGQTAGASTKAQRTRRRAVRRARVSVAGHRSTTYPRRSRPHRPRRHHPTPHHPRRRAGHPERVGGSPGEESSQRQLFSSGGSVRCWQCSWGPGARSPSNGCRGCFGACLLGCRRVPTSELDVCRLRQPQRLIREADGALAGCVRTGDPTTQQTLQVRSGERTARVELRFAVSGSRPLQGAATLQILDPAHRQASSGPISYTCPAG